MGADPAKTKWGKSLQIIIAPIIFLQILVMLAVLLFQVYLFVFESDPSQDSKRTCEIVTTADGSSVDTCEFLDY